MEQKHRFDETCRYEEGFTISNWNKLLDGKVVIVVGASYGMGKKYSLRLVVLRNLRQLLLRSKRKQAEKSPQCQRTSPNLPTARLYLTKQ